jgi:hypothetical protein
MSKAIIAVLPNEHDILTGSQDDGTPYFPDDKDTLVKTGPVVVKVALR